MYPRAVIFFICLFSSLAVFAQGDGKRLTELYNSKQYRAAIAEGRKLIANGTNADIASLLIGRCYVDMEEYDSSVAYLAAAIRLDKDRTWISGWAHAYLGTAFIKTDNTDTGVAELKKSISLDKTENSTKYAKQILLSYVDIDNVVSKMGMIKIESELITYYIQDTDKLSGSVAQYIARHDNAWVELGKIFRPQFPGRLSFYVFTNRRKAEKELGRSLGFSTPATLQSFSMYDQTLGHEMTHVAAYWAFGKKPVYASRFINEGIAVCFDMSGTDIYAKAADIAARNNIRKSVLDVWASDKSYPDDLIYAAGGAFMRYVYDNADRAVFESLIKDQRISHLRRLLNNDFDSFIEKFNTKVGLRK